MTSQREAAGRALAGGADTIVALATPPGRSAIAVVRLSGPHAHAVAGRIASPWPLPERVARLCLLRDSSTGEPVDRAIVTTYGAGRSYTGEPMVEISTHGGHLVPATVMAALIAVGAREALPGEFTRRAVLNGKVDLLRAEAVGDLIDARSRLMHRTALSQLDGGLSRRIEELRRGLVEIEALIAYDIDFPEEDDGPVDRARVLDACDASLAQLAALLSTAPAGELVRDGAVVVLAGAPNAGKSSLYNALLGQARALVTEIPGTTRDALEATIDADGWPLRLVDTAGLRDSDDRLERLGIEISERYLERAHLILACGETPEAIAATLKRVTKLTSAPVLTVQTKVDLATNRDYSSGANLVSPSYEHQGLAIPDNPAAALVSNSVQTTAGKPADDTLVANRLQVHPAAPPKHERYLVSESDQPQGQSAQTIVAKRDELPGAKQGSGAPVAVSALTGEGLGELRNRAVALLAAHYGAPSADLPMLTRARHVRALASARAELAAFRDAWSEEQLPAPIAGVHLREAVLSLETLIGAVDIEEILDRVFSSFCVGK